MALPNGPYNPQETEKEVLDFWLTNQFYKPEYSSSENRLQTIDEMKNDGRTPWCLVCPPPNAYGRPHIGNISGYAYQDAMARYQRMNGKKVLVLPGKDHAGLEGEGVFVRDVLEKKGINKFDLSREEFYQMIWDFNMENRAKALKDEKEIGLSADFDRDKFTLDPEIVQTVLSTFVEMYNEDMIYKGVRIVNWDPKARSVVADNQCVRKEREGKLYKIRYKLVDEKLDVERKTSDDKPNYIEVATTRPETMFGDTAVAVHPDDERYKDLVGKKVVIPLINREIPIITSPRVEKDFGTGALKITPAHAQDDFQIMTEWNSSQLVMNNEQLRIGYVNIIGKDLKLVGPVPENVKGMKYNAALPIILEDLKAQGLLVGEEKITQNILVAERTGAVIEPIMSSQWFISIDKIRQPVIDMVKEGRVKIHPKNMEDKFFFWMENLRDWAISRSLWWGYRMPVWYAGEIFEEIDENGQVETLISLGSRDTSHETVPLDPSNPEHMRVQVESPDWEAEKLVMVPGKHGYAHRKLFPELKKQFPNSITLNVKNIDDPSYKYYEEAFKSISFNKNDIVLCHSLGGRAFIRYLLDNKLHIKHLILLAPGARLSGREDGRDEKYRELIENISDYNQIKNYVGKVSLIYSNDELITEEQFKKFAEIINAEEVIREEGKMHYAGKEYEYHSESLTETLEIHYPQLKTVNWIQDENVLDTWFSSGQWPFATLMSENLMETFYPTDVMETGFDILENWVSRMMMFSYFKFKNKPEWQIPFKDVYLHGLVLGKDGQKMSKSKGNLVDIDQARNDYGTDAIRMVYFYQNRAGASYAFSPDKLKNFKQFMNKIWNASRFVLMHSAEDYRLQITDSQNLKLDLSKEVYEHITNLKQKITKNINEFEFGHATDTLYQEFWHTFCDIYIEKSKEYIKSSPQPSPLEREASQVKLDEQGEEVLNVMIYTLREYLKMLHPFIPFITERIWKELPKVQGDHESLMYSLW